MPIDLILSKNEKSYIEIKNDLIKHLGCSMTAEWYHDLASDFLATFERNENYGAPKHTFPTYMRERGGGRDRVGVVVFIRCANAYQCYLMFFQIIFNLLFFFFILVYHMKRFDRVL